MAVKRRVKKKRVVRPVDEEEEDDEEEPRPRKKKGKGETVAGTGRALTARSYMCQLIFDNNKEKLTDREILKAVLKRFPDSEYNLARVTRLRYKVNQGAIAWLGEPKREIKRYVEDEEEEERPRKKVKAKRR